MSVEFKDPLWSSIFIFVAFFISFLFLESTLNDNFLLSNVVNEHREDSFMVLWNRLLLDFFIEALILLSCLLSFDLSLDMDLLISTWDCDGLQQINLIQIPGISEFIAAFKI